MSAPEKLCVFCDHFGWNDYSITDYGGQTGAGIDSGGMTCAKGQLPRLYNPRDRYADHNDEVRPYDTQEFRRAIMCAAQCPDYSPPKAPRQKG